MKKITGLDLRGGPLDEKVQKLTGIIRDMQSLLVAYSGGVDSTLLLKVAHDLLGEMVLAVIGRSETYPERELSDAESFAREIGARYQVVDTRELENERFSSNPPDRCYHCKSELFCRLKDIAVSSGLAFIADGSNLDDTGDYRPGSRAAAELGVRSPLREAGFTKGDIRALSKELGLPTWDKPAQACLSSRFPYGTGITQERLDKVSRAEDFLHGLGFRCYRVRYHGDVARIEVPREEMHRLIDPETADRISEYFRGLGFAYTTLDMRGYRTGSMNEVLR